jgi:hypothetical protein
MCLRGALEGRLGAYDCGWFGLLLFLLVASLDQRSATKDQSFWWSKWYDLRTPNRTPCTGNPPSRCLYQTPAAVGGRNEDP